MNSITSTLTIKPLPWRIRRLLSILEKIQSGTLLLTTPDGIELELGDGCSPRVSLQLRSWDALRRIFSNGDIGLAECYRDGLIACDDLTALIRLAIRNEKALQKALHGHPVLQLGNRLRHKLRSNTRRGSKRNIHAHYDLGNDFYGLWLDSSMTYSSAQFTKGADTDLETAQLEKNQRILQLSGAKAGDLMLEIGCGWGGFAEHAARRGIQLQGVTLSQQQLAYAKQRLNRAGLTDSTDLQLRDYRDIDGQFDQIVSIEMLEAVGEKYWDGYFNKLHDLLKPGGKAVIQTITIDDDIFDDYRNGTDFIQQYVFPGGMLPCKSSLHKLAHAAGLRIAQVHAFGTDYAQTLRSWRANFERSLEDVRKLGFDEDFIRIWRFYLAYCEAGFDERRIDVVHLQLVRDPADVAIS